jgi:hypothetical protein
MRFDDLYDNDMGIDLVSEENANGLKLKNRIEKRRDEK